MRFLKVPATPAHTEVQISNYVHIELIELLKIMRKEGGYSSGIMRPGPKAKKKMLLMNNNEMHVDCSAFAGGLTFQNDVAGFVTLYEGESQATFFITKDSDEIFLY